MACASEEPQSQIARPACSVFFWGGGALPIILARQWRAHRPIPTAILASLLCGSQKLRRRAPLPPSTARGVACRVLLDLIDRGRRCMLYGFWLPHDPRSVFHMFKGLRRASSPQRWSLARNVPPALILGEKSPFQPTFFLLEAAGFRRPVVQLRGVDKRGFALPLEGWWCHLSMRVFPHSNV